MRVLLQICVGIIALGAWTAGTSRGRSDTPVAVTLAQGRQAVDRGLSFLQRDAASWRKDHQCATCHHGTMTVWALAEAKHQGYSVTAESLAGTAQWTKSKLLERLDLPRDPRPGWSMVSTPALYLALLARSVPQQDVVVESDLQRIAGHLLRHQEADGSWSWASAPLQNRPPPFFESDEVATLLACLALGPANSREKTDVRQARERAAAWLAKAKPQDTTQAAALRLLVKARQGEPAPPLELEQLLGRQNRDGGWGQVPDSPSDAYATGQALYVLNLVGVPNDRPAVRRGVKFLMETQKADGSWPMTARAHVGATPAHNTVPINYFGSAWATLGLLRSVPK